MDDSGIVSRRIEPVLRSYLRTFRITALLGPRQSGKMTLAKQLANGGVFLSLDNPDMAQAALDDPMGFVRDRRRPTVIDEVQRGGDDLVRAIKLVVDDERTPGSFLLTGSTNLLTVPDLSESLAGRMGIVELAPFSEAEAMGADSPGLMAWLIDRESKGFMATRFEELMAQQHSPVSRREHTERICSGGYPEAQLLGAVERGVFLRSLLTTIVSRDVREFSGARRMVELPRIAEALAARTAGELVIEDVHRDTAFGSSQTTADYIGYLEMVYLTVLLPAWSTSAATRVKRRSKLHMADSGLAATLLCVTPDSLSDPAEALRGPLYETFVANEIRKQLSFGGSGATLHHFRDRRQREVDLIVRLANGNLICIEVTAAMRAHGRKAETLGWLRDTVGDRFELGIVLYTGEQPLRLGPRIVAVPISYLWQM
ncbi:ATP-binding protein [Candidatus Poriferisodalis sp.]|uniref:ATP-binding protein n=1 Tax=Candidatus Poriferisodalis sp. TaxID=3101277 RepID=UPI003B02B2C7